MEFKGIRVSKTFNQINHATPGVIFPLLCPVREKEWIDGWDYEMIYSRSGFIEEGCIFSTPHHGIEPTIWYVTKYDQDTYTIEFVRISPGEEVVKIRIVLLDNNNGNTTSEITYEYTGLTEEKNTWILNQLDADFHESMIWWEKAINYYLKTGQKLLKK